MLTTYLQQPASLFCAIQFLVQIILGISGYTCTDCSLGECRKDSLVSSIATTQITNMANNNQKKWVHYLMFAMQIFFLLTGLFFLSERNYSLAGSTLILPAGLPYIQFRNNRMMWLLGWFAISIGIVALGIEFFMK